MKKSHATFLVIMLVAALAVPCAYAASPWTTETTYGGKAAKKLEFGLDNLFLGWTELFTQPRDSYRAKENIFLGIGKGVFNAVGQTVGGVLHIATSPLPMIDVPLPENGTQVNKKP